MACVGNAILGGHFLKDRHAFGVVALVDKQQVGPLRLGFESRRRKVNVHFAIGINVHQAHARTPAAQIRKSRLVADVGELHPAFVDINLAVDLISRENHVRQTVAVQVGDAHAAAVIDVLEVDDVHRIVLRQAVGEGHARVLGGQEGKEGLFLAGS